jgi:DNA-binding YbaB/EbfC family protein
MAEFDLNQIMDMARRVQEQMAQAQEQLATITVEGSAGGGLVNAVANCAREIVRVTIDPQAIELRDLPMLQDLVVAACNAALRQAAERAREELQKAAGGLPIPPGFL